MMSIIDKIDEVLNEAKKRKASFGKTKDMSYAVQIDSLDSNDFYTQAFGRQISDLKKADEFIKTAKKGYVDGKGKATLPAVRKWVKENQPSEFYAKWKSDSSWYKDDSIEIFYKK